MILGSCVLSAFWFEFAVVGVLIGLNGVLSLAEFAVISARKTRLQLMAANSVPGAQTALDLANAPSDFLASVQVGITLISVLTGVFGGARLADPLALTLQGVPWLEGIATEVAFGIVVVILSYVMLIVGELVLKRIGMSNLENIAKIFAKPLKVFARVVNPVASLLSYSTDLIVGMIGTRNSSEHEVTEEEVTIMVEQGTAAGVFEKAEETIIKRALRLGDK